MNVRHLQLALRSLGYPLPRSFAGDAPDGVIGPETTGAIADYARFHMGVPDATVGEVESHAIHSALTVAVEPQWIHGIDISAHQGAVDWASAVGHNIRFAYVKVSEGTGATRDYDREYRTELRNVGVPFGCYAFGRPDSNIALGMQDARREADTLLKRAEDDLGDYVPMLDLERAEGRSASGGENVQWDTYNVRWCLEWRQQILKQLGWPPATKLLLYTTGPSFWAYLRDAEDGLLEELADSYELMWAEYPRMPGHPNSGINNDWQFCRRRPPVKMRKLRVPWDEQAIWQWTGYGELPGFRGVVDRNVATRDALELLRRPDGAVA